MKTFSILTDRYVIPSQGVINGADISGWTLDFSTHPTDYAVCTFVLSDAAGNTLFARGFYRNGAMVGPVPAIPAIYAAPYIQQTGTNLVAANGVWTGLPKLYAYQWKRDGVNVGTRVLTYPLVGGDAGHTFTCTVSASNSFGATLAVSNALVAV